MTVIVFDNFNRPDSSTTMGTATTGQVWANVPGEGHVSPGDPYGILSNQGWWNRDGSGVGGDGLAALEAGLSNAKVSVRLMDVLAGGILNLRNQGILFRYVDATHYIFATYARAGGGVWRLYVADGSSSPTHVGPDSAAAPVNGDMLSVAFCNQEVTIALNGVTAENYPFTFFPALSSTLLAGTKCGLQSSGGVISSPPFQLFEDFQVETNDACEIAQWTIPHLLWSAEGTIATAPTQGLATKRFDAGLGSRYYLVPAITDSSNELRSKQVKALRATGKFTEASMVGYGYDVETPINVTDLEEGANSSTGAIPITDSTQVVQSQRAQVNIPNSVLWTMRVEGDDTGQEERDRIDELSIEVSEQGVRR